MPIILVKTVTDILKDAFPRYFFSALCLLINPERDPMFLVFLTRLNGRDFKNGLSFLHKK